MTAQVIRTLPSSGPAEVNDRGAVEQFHRRWMQAHGTCRRRWVDVCPLPVRGGSVGGISVG
jgi:hypothetical protein